MSSLSPPNASLLAGNYSMTEFLTGPTYMGVPTTGAMTYGTPSHLQSYQQQYLYRQLGRQAAGTGTGGTGDVPADVDQPTIVSINPLVSTAASTEFSSKEPVIDVTTDTTPTTTE